MERCIVFADSSDPSGPSETAQLRGTTERAIATLWMEVLALPELPAADDNFFSLGGDSTAMVMVEMRIQEEFSVELPFGSLLNVPSLRELAHLIEAPACPSGMKA
jgi:acyl carrier protein